MCYEFSLDKHKGAKISTLNKFDPITDMRALLSESQLADFSQSCFGHLMNLPNFKIQHQLIHNLLLRQLKQPNNHEIWIGVGGVKLKFGIEEFAVISGLKCVGNSDKMRFAKPTNNFLSTYYSGYNIICKSAVKSSFFLKEWENDKDAVKMAKLFFLHHFLLTSSTDTHVPKGDFDMLDGDKFDEFPWGKEVFRMTVESLKNSGKTTSKDNYYRLTGFPYVFQVWFYESCPYLNGKYCEHNGSSIPRMLNWTTDYSGRFDEFYTTLSLDSVQVCICFLFFTFHVYYLCICHFLTFLVVCSCN